MLITKNEYFKLFSNKVFIICIIASFCANLFFINMMQASDFENKAISDNPEIYEQLLDDFNNADDKTSFIESKRIEAQIALILCRNNDAGRYKEMYPEEYNNAVDLNLSEDELTALPIMIDNIRGQMSYTESYDVFISEMQTRADQQSSFSVFAKPDSFSYKNIAKTPLDFAKVSNVVPIIGNNYAIETATQFALTDYCMLLIVLLMCIVMFSLEREKGLYSLVRSTKNGRTKTIINKLLVVISNTAGLGILFYVSNIFMCGFLFGFGDLSRPVQSSNVFMNCTIDISVLNYFVIWVLGKVIFLCSVAAIISLLFVVVSSPAKSYIILALAFIFEFSCSVFIKGNSIFGAFKYINIFYLLSGNNIFGVYQNVNLFSEPVNITTVFMVLVVAFLVIGIVCSCVAFSKLSFTNSSNILFEKIFARLNNFRKIKGSVCIYNGEAYKHYKTSLAIVAVALLIVMAFLTLNDKLTILFTDPQESAYNTYMQTLEGELNDEKYEFIESEKQYFEELTQKQEAIYNDTSLSYDERERQLTSIQNILESKGSAFEDICFQVAFAENKAEIIGKPPALINEIVNKRLVLDTFREWKYFTLLLAVVIFCTSNIFACEHKKSMINMLRTNKYGKSKLLFTKLTTVLITSILSFILIYLPYMINFIKTFGAESFEIPLAYSRDFSMLESPIKVSEYIFILGFLHLFTAIMATALVYMLSYILKNQFVTLIISSGIFLIPCIFFLSNSEVRAVSAFINNSQDKLIISVMVICLLFIALSVSVTYIKYNNIKWGRKNA